MVETLVDAAAATSFAWAFGVAFFGVGLFFGFLSTLRKK